MTRDSRLSPVRAETNVDSARALPSGGGSRSEIAQTILLLFLCLSALTLQSYFLHYLGSM